MNERTQILPRCLTEEMLDLVEKAGWWQRVIGAIYVLGAVASFLLGAIILMRTGGAALFEAGTQAFSGAVTLIIGLVLRKHGWIARTAFRGRTISSMHSALETQRNLLIVATFLVVLFIALVALAVIIPMWVEAI